MVKSLGIQHSEPIMGFGRNCSIAPSYKGRIFVCTGQGLTEEFEVKDSKAPSLVCLDKHTGKVMWQDNSPGKNIIEGQWDSPLVVEIDGKGQVIVLQGDGWLRSFDALTGEPLWQCATNDPKLEHQRRNYGLSFPVYHDGRIYVVNGRSPCSPLGSFEGAVLCVDHAKKGDISPTTTEGRPNPNSGVIWRLGGREGQRRVISGSLGSVAIHRGLLVALDQNGYVYCLDARTGRPHWKHDVRTGLNNAPLIVHDKIYVMDEDGACHILALSSEKKVLAVHDLEEQGVASPVFANGVLYLSAGPYLYAIQDRKQSAKDVERPTKPERRPDAIFVPTPQEVVEKMLELARVKKADVVYDLGCGDGRIVVTAAQKYGCRALGFDIDPNCVQEAKARARLARVDELVTIEHKDVFTLDLSQADVVTLYLGTRLNAKLLPQLQRLKAGARVISHQFPLDHPRLPPEGQKVPRERFPCRRRQGGLRFAGGLFRGRGGSVSRRMKLVMRGLRRCFISSVARRLGCPGPG